MAIKRYLGIGKETTFATQATTPEIYLDTQDASIDPSGGTTVVYQGMSGLDKTIAAGSYMSGGKFSFPIDSKSFGHFAKFALGVTGYSKTGTAPSVTHLFNPSQAPLMDSFTTFVGKDYFEHQFSGCVIKTLTIDLKDSFLTGSVDLVGGKDAKGALAASPSFTAGTLYAPHNVTVSIAGTDQSLKIEEFSIKIDTGADNKSGVTVGSRFPRRAFRGALKVEMDMTLSFFDTAELERFWGGAAGPTDNVSEFAIAINAGTELDISIPRAIYDSVQQPVGGRGRITQKAKIVALLANDGTGPIQFSLTNDTATY